MAGNDVLLEAVLGLTAKVEALSSTSRSNGRKLDKIDKRQVEHEEWTEREIGELKAGVADLNGAEAKVREGLKSVGLDPADAQFFRRLFQLALVVGRYIKWVMVGIGSAFGVVVAAGAALFSIKWFGG